MKNRKSGVRKQDYLVNLIHALTPAEKGYFKKFISTRSDRKNYEKLFDTLEKYTEYNAEEVAKKLGKSRQNLAHDKDYLQEVLLKALRNYHEKGPRYFMHVALLDSTILMNKGQVEHAQLIIDKGLEDARAGRHNYTILELLAGQRLVLRKTLGPLEHEFYVAYKKNADETREQLNLLKLHIDMEEFGVQISAHLKHRTFDQNEKEARATAKLLRHPLLKKKFRYPLFQVQQHAHISSLLMFSGNPEQAAHHMKQALDISERYKEEHLLDSMSLTLAIISYVRGLIASNQINEAEVFMLEVEHGKYDHLLVNQPLFKEQIGDKFPGLRVEKYLRQLQDGDEVDQLEINRFLNSFDEQRNRLEKKYRTDLWINTLFRIARIYFLMGDYHQASDRLWELYQRGDIDLEPRRSCVIRLAYVILQYENGNQNLVPGLVRSIRSLFKKNNLDFPVEDIVLLALLKLVKTDDKKQRLEIFRQLKTRLQEFKNRAMMRPEMEMFDYDTWVNRNLLKK